MPCLLLSDTPLAGVRVVQRQPRADPRGAFARIFCAQELAEAGWSKPLAQVNHSRTSLAGTVRGLHWQRAPDTEMKLVTCLAGEVWDVVVDLRPGSPATGAGLPRRCRRRTSWPC